MAELAPQSLSGSSFGSFAGLYLGTAIPCLAFFLVLGVFDGKMLIGPVGSAIGLWVVSHFVQRVSTIVVSEDGIAYRYGLAPGVQLAIIDVFLPWENIQSVQEHRFSALVILKKPQQIGLFERRKLRFAYLDPDWCKRPTSVAILGRCGQ
jgi:hypothetical protein